MLRPQLHEEARGVLPKSNHGSVHEMFKETGKVVQ